MNRRILVTLCILSLAMAFFVSPAFAKGSAKKAVEKGSVMLGGDADFSLALGSRKVEPDGEDDMKSDLMDFGLGALGGYFVIPNLEVGGLLTVDYSKDDGDDEETKETTWLIGPQVGYFHPVGGNISVFGLGALGYAKMTIETEETVNNNKNKTEITSGGFFFEPRGGVVFHLNNKMGIFASLFFRYTKGSGDWDGGDESVDIDVTETRYGLKAGILGFL
jgi:hypothetical protein